MSTEEIAGYLQRTVDWDRFCRLTYTLGNQLNTKQLRFLKARIYEMAVEFYSDNRVKYIAENGRDFVIPELNDTYVEMKFCSGAIFKRNGKLRTNCNMILYNSISRDSGNITLPEEFAEYLLFVSERGCILFDKKTYAEYCVVRGDTIQANIPTERGFLIEKFSCAKITPKDFIESLNESIQNYFMSV